MPARLTVYATDQPVHCYPLDPQHDYLIGRGSDCDLRISDQRLSRAHARLCCRDGLWLLSDLDSKNGIQLSGREVIEAALQAGDWISFGGLLASFDVVTEEQVAADRQRAQTRWNTTVDLSRRLDVRAEMQALLQQLLDAVLQLADAERGFVMLADPRGELIVRTRATRNGVLPDEARFPGSESAVRQVLQSRRPVVVCDARADLLLAARPSIESGDIRALICLPLPVADRLAGVIYVDSHSPGKLFTDLDMELLEAFAAHAALLVGVAALRRELAGLAALLPAELGRAPQAGELVRRLQAVLPRDVTLAPADGRML